MKPQSIADFALTNSKTGLWVNMYPGYQNFESFRDGYKSKFGVKPYTSQVQSSKWYVSCPPQLKLSEAHRRNNRDRGSQVTKEMFDKGLSQIRVFKEWIETHVMGIEGRGNSSAMMVLAVGPTHPLYRDRDPEPFV